MNENGQGGGLEFKDSDLKLTNESQDDDLEPSIHDEEKKKGPLVRFGETYPRYVVFDFVF